MAHAMAVSFFLRPSHSGEISQSPSEGRSLPQGASQPLDAVVCGVLYDGCLAAVREALRSADHPLATSQPSELLPRGEPQKFVAASCTPWSSYEGPKGTADEMLALTGDTAGRPPLCHQAHALGEVDGVRCALTLEVVLLSRPRPSTRDARSRCRVGSRVRSMRADCVEHARCLFCTPLVCAWACSSPRVREACMSAAAAAAVREQEDSLGARGRRSGADAAGTPPASAPAAHAERSRGVRAAPCGMMMRDRSKSGRGRGHSSPVAAPPSRPHHRPSSTPHTCPPSQSPSPGRPAARPASRSPAAGTPSRAARRSTARPRAPSRAT
jgi:hypothetical protein